MCIEKESGSKEKEFKVELHGFESLLWIVYDVCLGVMDAIKCHVSSADEKTKLLSVMQLRMVIRMDGLDRFQVPSEKGEGLNRKNSGTYVTSV